MEAQIDFGNTAYKNFLIRQVLRCMFVIIHLGQVSSNKIEHRMFSHISMQWKGQPLRT